MDTFTVVVTVIAVAFVGYVAWSLWRTQVVKRRLAAGASPERGTVYTHDDTIGKRESQTHASEGIVYHPSTGAPQMGGGGGS